MDTSEYIFDDVILPGPNHWSRRFRVRRQVVQGFSLSMLTQILMANRFQVDWQYGDKLAYLYVTAVMHTFLNALERRLFSERIDSTELLEPPLFLLGHWRNGTTFLHNLLCKDPNHTFPRSYQTIFSGSFLLPGLRKMTRKSGHRIPIKKRPMDNVKFGLYEPAEDDFIMTTLTGISPYIRVMFPRKLGVEADYRYPDFRSEKEIDRWKSAFVYLLKRLTIFENKRIVLKSPSHTARIKVLLELFPDAKFVHIVRHPYDVFPSNLRLWRDAFSLSFLQAVTRDEIVEMVLSTYDQVYQRYHGEKSYIPESSLVEIRFEDLEEDPIGQLRHIYDKLDLPGFDAFSRLVSAYLEKLGNYKKNVFEITPAIKRKIRKRWSETFDIYGYRD